MPGSGLIDVVDTVGVVKADRSDVGTAVGPWLASTDPAQHRYLVMDFPRTPTAPPTLTGTAPSPPGRVVGQDARLDDGELVARVQLDRPAVVVAKVSYHPRWRVLVDGKKIKPMMVTPGIPGVVLPAGQHDVAFVYETVSFTGPLLLLGLLALVALAVVPRWWYGRRKPSAADDAAPVDPACLGQPADDAASSAAPIAPARSPNSAPTMAGIDRTSDE
jgi:hypothetical protein